MAFDIGHWVLDAGRMSQEPPQGKVRQLGPVVRTTSSGQRSSSRSPRWRWRRYGRQSYPFGIRPGLKMASRGRSALFSDNATRMRASPRRCQCLPLALSLSASLLHEGSNVSVPRIASVLSDCKPKPNAHVLGTRKQYFLIHTFEISGALLPKESPALERPVRSRENS